MADPSSSRRRTLRDADDLEEGEFVPGAGYDSSDTDDDAGYWCQRRREDDPQHGRHVRSVEDIVAAVDRLRALPRSPTSSYGSEDTVSDHGNPSATSSVVGGAPTPARRFSCHVCGKAFGSSKAVDGHMRVHRHERHAAAPPSAVGGGWATTGKRGWAGCKPSAVALSLNSGSSAHSRAIVAAAAAQPLKPVPMAMAMPNLSSMPAAPSAKTNLSGTGEETSSSASVQPMQRDEHGAAAVAAGAKSSTGAVAPPPCAAPTAAEETQQVHRPDVPPPAVQQEDQLVLGPAKPPREYSCKDCGKSYPTPQGLGGHVAGHRGREAAAVGMTLDGGGAFLAAHRRGRKAEKKAHACDQCDRVFARGVSLGGHKRRHYKGPPIVNKRSKKGCLAPPPEVVVAVPATVVSAEKEEPPPSAAPAVPGRVRLFGVDIGPMVVQASPEEKGPGTTEEGSSSAADQK